MGQLNLLEYPIPNDLRRMPNNKLDVSESSKVISQIVETLKKVKYVDVSEQHYLLLSKLALYAEEHKFTNEIKTFKLMKRKIERLDQKSSSLKLFQIAIGECIEDKIWIKVGDFVDVFDIEFSKLYSMRVIEVKEGHVVFSDVDANIFQRSYRKEKIYNIQFRFNNYDMSCVHFVLSLMNEKNTLTYLFPFKNKPFIKDNISIEFNDFEPINSVIKNNSEQIQAVFHIINKASFPVPYILYGPPGTGKTTTVVEATCQVYNSNPESHILICSPSDSKTDELTKKLLRYIVPANIYRVYSLYTDPSTIDKEIKQCANTKEGKILFPTYDKIVKKRIIITTLSNCVRLIRGLQIAGLKGSFFSHIMIDDASQAAETDVLMPLSLAYGNGNPCSQIVLAGDPLQLGSIMKSHIAKAIFGRSILERLMTYDIYQKDSNDKYNPKYITKLIQNYCNHSDIIHVSNALFYNTKLITKYERNANEKFPIIFYGIDSEEKKVNGDDSFYNTIEIDIVVDYVDDLLNNHDPIGIGEIRTKDIGIITPYTLQIKKIKNSLKRKKIQGITVGTADFFKNKERKIIIMTTVKSKTFEKNGLQHIGILSDPKSFNTVITKAKEFLIVVGNPKALQIDKNWHFLMQYCMNKEVYKGDHFSLQDISSQNEYTSEEKTFVKSSNLFDDNLLKMLTIDEFNSEINSSDTTNLSIESLFNNYVNAMKNWDTCASNKKIDHHFGPMNSSSQMPFKSEDIFQNVNYFHAKEFHYTDTQDSYKKRKNPVEENIFKRVNYLNRPETDNPTGLKNSLNELKNLVKGNVSQRKIIPDIKESKSSSAIQNPLYNEDLLMKVFDSKNDRRTEIQNSDLLQKSNEEQKNLLKNSISRNFSNSNDIKLEVSVEISTDNQIDLIDFDSHIENSDNFNLIDFDDVSDSFKNIPNNCDSEKSNYIDLL